MIKRLRIRFVQIGMLVFCLVVVLLAGMINLVSHLNNERQSGYVLTFLIENGGVFPRAVPQDSDFTHNFRGYSPETKYETRYFSVLIGQDGAVTETNVDSIAAISDQDAVSYAEQVLDKGETDGYLGVYKFRLAQTDEGTLIVFLNCNSARRTEHMIMQISILIAAAALVMVFLFLLLFSRRAVAPIAESIEKQKQFITDAGHELKTPLAIISANTEVLEITDGITEWTQSTRHQTARLSELIGQLLTLSRLQEAPENVELEMLHLSSLLQQEAAPFATLAQSKEKQLALEIAPDMNGKANGQSIRKLISILLDNAVKYADAGGTIQLCAFLQKHALHIEVRNPCTGAVPEEFGKVFGRFYRADHSRSRETGSFGIGLSIAQAVTVSCHGKIAAAVQDDGQVCFSVALPVG